MPEEEKKIKVNLDPVLYALSNVNIGFNQEIFDFVMISGNQARQFRSSPKHAKRILLLLEKQIDQYEKKFGLIEAELPQEKEATHDERLGFGL